MITEIAHQKVSSLHVGGQTVKKKGLNHLRLALLPTTFYRMRHAMKQTHPKKIQPYHIMSSFVSDSLNGPMVGRLENVEPVRYVD